MTGEQQATDHNRFKLSIKYQFICGQRIVVLCLFIFFNEPLKVKQDYKPLNI